MGVNITVPNELLGDSGLTKEDLQLDLAIGLYVDRRVSSGKAAAIAGLSVPAFLDLLGSRGVCLDYEVDDLEDDLRKLDELRRAG
jgi:predicted HTH domain antitoxin